MMKLIGVSLVTMAFISSSMAIAGHPVGTFTSADKDEQRNAVHTESQLKKRLLYHRPDEPRQMPIGSPFFPLLPPPQSDHSNKQEVAP